ncbi:MAG TPA: hypothetical protein PKE47_07795 [Verrucomicrobiota bacterium]|nr:hypothetical protein [Verrucomicrobiota bacterium]
MSKPVTPKQLAANRRNAARATGPRTPAGKAASSRNALRHGLLSPQVLVRKHAWCESPREFNRFRQGLWDDLQPRGTMEALLADRIVMAAWSLRRVHRAEAGEMALNMDRQHRRHHGFLAVQSQRLEWRLADDAVSAMSESLRGVWVLKGGLRARRRGGVGGGGRSLDVIGQVGSRPNRLRYLLRQLHAGLEENPEGLAPEALRDRNLGRVLEFLDGELGRLRYEERECEAREECEAEARQAASLLPDAEAMDKLHRYETKHERQMYRAMAQLERLQRRRLGENVPPPVSVAITERP